MIFDESDARITNILTGKVFDYFYRQGKELHIVTTCGHDVVLQSDIEGDINCKSVGVKVIIPAAELFSEAGKV